MWGSHWNTTETSCYCRIFWSTFFYFPGFEGGMLIHVEGDFARALAFVVGITHYMRGTLVEHDHVKVRVNFSPVVMCLAKPIFSSWRASNYELSSGTDTIPSNTQVAEKFRTGKAGWNSERKPGGLVERNLSSKNRDINTAKNLSNVDRLLWEEAFSRVYACKFCPKSGPWKNPRNSHSRLEEANEKCHQKARKNHHGALGSGLSAMGLVILVRGSILTSRTCFMTCERDILALRLDKETVRLCGGSQQASAIGNTVQWSTTTPRARTAATKICHCSNATLRVS